MCIKIQAAEILVPEKTTQFRMTDDSWGMLDFANRTFKKWTWEVPKQNPWMLHNEL